MKTKTEIQTIQKEVTIYIASDGREFPSERACVCYEKELERKQWRKIVRELEWKNEMIECPLSPRWDVYDACYTWYKVNTKEEFNMLKKLHYKSEFEGHDITFPQIICVEEFDGESEFHYVDKMIASTKSFWNAFGYDVEFKQKAE